MGTTIDLCLQKKSVTRAGQDFLLKQIFSANFRKNKIDTWAETSYLLFFLLHIKMQLFLSLTFSLLVCCSFFDKEAPYSSQISSYPWSGERWVWNALWAAVPHQWEAIPALFKEPAFGCQDCDSRKKNLSECAREHLKCYLTVVKIWPSSTFQLSYQENAVHYGYLNNLTSPVWLLIFFFYYCPFYTVFVWKDISNSQRGLLPGGLPQFTQDTAHFSLGEKGPSHLLCWSLNLGEGGTEAPFGAACLCTNFSRFRVGRMLRTQGIGCAVGTPDMDWSWGLLVLIYI